jgi:hypothetical protein
MAYTKYHADWQDYPSTATPITAAALEQIEQGIADAADDADTANTDLAAYADATKELTNTTLDFDFDTTGNVASNIPYDAIPGLEGDLGSVSQIMGLPIAIYDGSNYPNRSESGNVDPNYPTLWIRGPGPTKGGTGSTGACVGDLWLRAV